MVALVIQSGLVTRGGLLTGSDDDTLYGLPQRNNHGPPNSASLLWPVDISPDQRTPGDLPGHRTASKRNRPDVQPFDLE